MTPQINLEVIELWKRYSKDVRPKHIPLLYPPLDNMKKDGLLTVGLNPSFGTRWSWLKKTAHKKSDPKRIFHWRYPLKPHDLEIAQAIDKDAKEKYDSYYKKFRLIAEHAELTWEHVDLFFYRVTSQKKLKEVIYNNGELNAFGKEQLELSTQVMSEVQPRVILVASAFASDILKSVLGHKLMMKFEEDLGCHTIQLGGSIVPIFLASMLTGQRAMDKYSYQRLEWHIKKVSV